MAIKIIGNGLFGAGAEGGELAQSVTTSESVEETTLKNAKGEFVGVALGDPVKEITLEVAASDGDEPPACGESFAGGTVTSRTKTASNSAFSTWSVTVKKWGSIGGGA